MLYNNDSTSVAQQYNIVHTTFLTISNKQHQINTNKSQGLLKDLTMDKDIVRNITHK